MRVAVSSWSLNKKFVTEGMTMPEFIGFVKEEYGVDAIEAVNWMICPLTSTQQKIFANAHAVWGNPDSTSEMKEEAGKGFSSVMNELNVNSSKGLDEIKAALDKYGVKICNMPIDYGNISQLDAEARNADIKIIKTWIDAAAYLGSESARVNTGHQPGGAFDLSITADSYRELADYAQSKGVFLVLENHGGMSADPDNIIKLFEMVNHPNFRICPDFGNFEDSIRYEALDKVWNNPVLVHAKTYEFDENGEHTPFDFKRCMEIAKSHGYAGYYSVEFEGPGDQVEGVRKTIRLLEKYM